MAKTGSQRWLNEKRVRELHVEYQQGASLARLAKSIRATPQGLSKAFKRLGLNRENAKVSPSLDHVSGPARRRKVTLKECERIFKDRSAGHTIGALATKYNRDESVIYRALARWARPHAEKRPSKGAVQEKMSLAKQALKATNARSRDRDRDAVVKEAISEFIRSVGGLEVQEVRIRIPSRTYEATYMHTEEGQC